MPPCLLDTAKACFIVTIGEIHFGMWIANILQCVQCEPVPKMWVGTVGANPWFGFYGSLVISKIGPSTAGIHQLVIHSVT